jgi:DNA-binding Lrp family transcriptional regulator
MMGGAGTSEAIAQTLGVDRSGVSHQLCKLERDGVLQKVDVSLVPGRDRKRPHRLFGFADLDLRNFEAQLNYLAASLVISRMCPLNHSLSVYDPETGILGMKDDRDSATIDRLMIDDHRVLVRQLFQKICELSTELSRNGSPIVVAMCDESRMAQLKVLDPAIKIADLRTPV